MTRSEDKQADRAIGLKLRYARRRQFLLQEDLANALSISAPQVDAYEQGKQRMPAETLYAAAALLGQKIDWFYAIEDSQEVKGLDDDPEYIECLNFLNEIRNRKPETLTTIRDILKLAATDHS